MRSYDELESLVEELQEIIERQRQDILNLQALLNNKTLPIVTELPNEMNESTKGTD